MSGSVVSRNASIDATRRPPLQQRVARPRARGRASTGAFRIHVARTVEEVEALRPVWRELGSATLTADLDHYLMSLHADERTLRPHVVHVEASKGGDALVLARLQRVQLGARLGYASVGTRALRAIVTAYGGCLGVASESVSEAVTNALWRSLSANEADVVIFRHLIVDEALHRVARRRPPLLCRQHGSNRHVHRELTLPPSYEEFLRSRSRSTRNHIKRYGNLVLRELGDRLTVDEYSRPEQLDAMFEAVQSVAVKTYQHGLGTAFLDTARNRTETRFLMERGWFRAWVLRVDGEPAAFWHGDVYAGRFRTGTPGYDPAFARYRLGTFLLMRIFEELSEDPSVQVVDFGVGEADYKRHYGDRAVAEEDVFVYAPRLSPVSLNMIQTATLAAGPAVKAGLRRVGLYGALRRAWRSRLSETGQRTAASGDRARSGERPGSTPG